MLWGLSGIRGVKPGAGVGTPNLIITAGSSLQHLGFSADGEGWDLSTGLSMPPQGPQTTGADRGQGQCPNPAPGPPWLLWAFSHPHSAATGRDPGYSRASHRQPGLREVPQRRVSRKQLCDVCIVICILFVSASLYLTLPSQARTLREASVLASKKGNRQRL